MFLATMLAGSQPVGAQTFAPYSGFKAMSVAQLATLQVKLTYVGDQTVGINTVAFTAPGNPVDLTLFTPYRRPGLHYANDDISPRAFAATTLQLKALIDRVGNLPDVTDGDVDPDGSVSFALLNTAGGTTKVFEAVVNGRSGPALFDKMLSALAGNSDGIRALTDFGSDVHLLPASTLLSSATATAQKSSARGGLLEISLEGNVDSVVLIDPQGRRDDEGPATPVSEIPGCMRQHDVQEPESEVPVLLFEIEDAPDGRYRVLAHLNGRQDVAVSADRTCGSGTVNSGDWRGSLRPGGRHAWTIDVGRTANGDSCWVKVKEVTRKAVPRRHRG